VVNVLRFLPRPGTNAAQIAGARLQGSNTSPTAGFVDLLTITRSVVYILAALSGD